MADKKFVHVLIAVTYESDDPIPSRMLGNILGSYIGVTEKLHTLTTYQMPYAVDPMQCGLREVWGKIDREQRFAFGQLYPELATAIALMCGGDDGKARSTGSPETNLVQGSDGKNAE